MNGRLIVFVLFVVCLHHKIYFVGIMWKVRKYVGLIKHNSLGIFPKEI